MDNKIEVIENKWRKIFTIILLILFLLLISLITVRLLTKQETTLRVDPEKVVIKNNESGLITAFISIDKPIKKNSTTIQLNLKINKSNPNYIKIINPYTNKEQTDFNVELLNIKKGKALIQFYVEARKVKGQKISNWWIDLYLINGNNTIEKSRVFIEVK